MKKTLYFEGAGCVPCGEVENCRIRTAFRDADGRAIYLEITSIEVTKYTSKMYKHFRNVGFIDACFYIDDEYEPIERGYAFEYTKANILQVVNSLGCSFDEVVILPNLAGYRVFRDDGYNFGDEFVFDAERTARAEKIKDYFYAIEKAEGKKYPNLSLWVDDEDPGLLHLLRHFNGYNKHWIIENIENWQETIREVRGKGADITSVRV